MNRDSGFFITRMEKKFSIQIRDQNESISVLLQQSKKSDIYAKFMDSNDYLRAGFKRMGRDSFILMTIFGRSFIVTIIKGNEVFRTHYLMDETQ